MSEKTDKICPLMSTADKPVYCNSSCQLFRPKNAKGYECVLQEISSVAWNIRNLKPKPPANPSSGGFKPMGGY